MEAVEIGPSGEAERLVTEKQRTARIRRGIDRGRAKDPASAARKPPRGSGR